MAGVAATVLEMFFGVKKVAPLVTERLKKISPFSLQTTLIFPDTSTASAGVMEAPDVFEMFVLAEKLAPLFVERLKKISPLSFQTILILPAASTAMADVIELPGVLEIFWLAEKLDPPFVERAKRISRFPEVSSCHTTSILPELSTATAGFNDEPIV